MDSRVRLAVIYNNFRDTYPNLCGNLNRYVSPMKHSFLIFNSYLNDKGNEVYYLAYFSCIQNK
jgi:hypothetical protein